MGVDGNTSYGLAVPNGAVKTTDPGTFRDFAAVCEAVRAQPGRSAKIALLAAYLRTLPPGDVPTGTRFLSARAFSAGSPATLGAGGALVLQAVIALLSAHADRPGAKTVEALQAAFHKHGEIGEAVRDFWPALPAGAGGLTLAEVGTVFSQISAVGGAEAKRRLLMDLLARAAPVEVDYLIKIILGDMRIGASEGVVEMALARAFDAPLPAVRQARLLLGDLDAVAALAARNALAQAKFRPFHPVAFMLAQPAPNAAAVVATLAGRAAWAEDKFDGIRAQAHACSGNHRVELFSRGSGNVSVAFPDIAAPMLKYCLATQAGFVLDGEIVPLRRLPDGATQSLPFAGLQRRLGRKAPDAAFMARYPCAFVAFDLLWINGELLFDVPLHARRKKLAELFAAVPPHDPFFVAQATPLRDAGDLEDLFAAARLRRNEGLVIKQADSLYAPGRRGDAWMKLKSHLPTLDCVVVAAERGHGKRRDVLSDITFAVRSDEVGGGLAVIGKAYSGLTDGEIAQLTEQFRGETLEVAGRVHRLQPRVVVEIAFDQITRSGRHDSGFALRFPRIARLRPDKGVGDIDALARVREIFNSQENLSQGPADHAARENAVDKMPPGEAAALAADADAAAEQQPGRTKRRRRTKENKEQLRLF